MREHNVKQWPSDLRAPLADFELVHTDDLEEAREVAAGVYAPHTIALERRTERLGCHLNATRFGAVACAFLAYESAINLAADGPDDAIIVGLPLSGRLTGSQDATEISVGHGSAWILPPSCSFAVRMSSRFRMVSFIISRNAVEQHLRNLSGHRLDRRIAFEPVADGRHWQPAITLVSHVFDDGQKPTPALLAHLGQLIVTTLLVAQTHSYSEDLVVPSGPVVPGAVLRAREAIEDSPEQPWSAATIASAAGVSVRSLQTAFRRHLGVPPMGYLEDVRLQRAHAELLAADGSTTVTEVALHWGFAHLGRFAAKYRQRYGRSPSETLRSRR